MERFGEPGDEGMPVLHEHIHAFFSCSITLHECVLYSCTLIIHIPIHKHTHTHTHTLPLSPSLPPPSLPPSPPPSLSHPHSNNLLILGRDNANVPRILIIIATVCEANALEEDKQVLMRLLSIARHIQV